MTFASLRRSAGLAFVVALALGPVAGCASKPSMTVKHAEVQGMQVGFPPQVGVVMTVVLDVYNPNSYDVAIRAVRGQVTFMDKWTMPVDFKPGGEGTWLAAKSMTTVRVPTTVPIDLALTLVRAAYLSPNVPFRVVGKADVTATRSLKIESDDWSVDEKGEISRQQIEASIPATFLGGLGARLRRGAGAGRSPAPTGDRPAPALRPASSVLGAGHGPPTPRASRRRGGPWPAHAPRLSS